MPFDVNGAPLTAPVMTFQPLSDRVLLLPIEESEVTLSGRLYKPEIAREKPQLGQVLAVGPGRMTEDGVVIPNPIVPGDRVMYGKYAGTEIELNGVMHLVIRATDVLGRVEVAS